MGTKIIYGLIDITVSKGIQIYLKLILTKSCLDIFKRFLFLKTTFAKLYYTEVNYGSILKKLYVDNVCIKISGV